MADLADERGLAVAVVAQAPVRRAGDDEVHGLVGERESAGIPTQNDRGHADTSTSSCNGSDGTAAFRRALYRRRYSLAAALMSGDRSPF